MDLAARYVADGRRVIAEIEAVDITSPDLPRPTLAMLITRLTEMLRTTTDHTERLGQANAALRTESAELEGQVRALHNAAQAAA